MFDRLKSKIDETRTFVAQHQTSTACAVTAIITWKITRDSAPTRSDFDKIVRQVMDLTEQNRLLQLHSGVILDFVNSKNLKDELLTFVEGLKE
jgi:hypothetical protein